MSFKKQDFSMVEPSSSAKGKAKVIFLHARATLVVRGELVGGGSPTAHGCSL